MDCKDKYSKRIKKIIEREIRRRRVGGEARGTLQMVRKTEEVREALDRVEDLLMDVSRLIDEYNEHPMFGEYLVTVDERAEVECKFMRHAVEYMQDLLEALPEWVTVKALKERINDEDDEEETDEEASCDCGGHCKDCCPGDDEGDDDWCAVIYFDGENEGDDDDDPEEKDEEEKAPDTENDEKVLLKRCLDLIEKLTKEVEENKETSKGSRTNRQKK